MSTYPYSFQANITKYDYQKYYYTVVYVPDDLAQKLDLESHMRLRVEVEIDGFPAKGTLMPDKVGSKQTEHLLKQGYKINKRIWYYQIPKRVLKEIDRSYGDNVNVEMRIGDQNEVEMHPAQEEFLEQRPDLKVIWDKLTPGKRRGLSYKVIQAKTDLTLNKRLDELEDLLLSL